MLKAWFVFLLRLWQREQQSRAPVWHLSLRESCEPRAGSVLLTVSCRRDSPVVGQGGEERALGGHLAVGTSGAFLKTCELGWGWQPGIGDLQQLQSPEVASQLPVQSRSYKHKGQLGEGTKKVPILPLGRCVFPPVAPKGAETELVGLPGPHSLGEQATAAEEKCGQGRHY